MHESFCVNNFVTYANLLVLHNIFHSFSIVCAQRQESKEASWAWAKGTIVYLWLQYSKVVWNRHRAVRHKGLWDTRGSFVNA